VPVRVRSVLPNAPPAVSQNAPGSGGVPSSCHNGRMLPVDQLNYSAHLVRDGYWVDLHVSQLLAEGADEQAIPTVLKSISLHPKGC
jgi:hypothetical protein